MAGDGAQAGHHIPRAVGAQPPGWRRRGRRLVPGGACGGRARGGAAFSRRLLVIYEFFEGSVHVPDLTREVIALQGQLRLWKRERRK